MNDDVRSPGSGSTPGPLSQQPPHGLDTDPGKFNLIFILSIDSSSLQCIQFFLNDVNHDQQLHTVGDYCIPSHYEKNIQRDQISNVFIPIFIRLTLINEITSSKANTIVQ